MQQVSALYEEIFRSQQYYMETSLVVGENGVLITENAERILFGGTAILVSSGGAESGYGETMLISMKTTRRVFKDNKPEVGCCPCGEIYVEMHMPRGYIARKAELIPYVRLVSKVDGRFTEWIRKGKFYIDTRDNTHNDDDLDILTVHGYDAMMFAEQPYGEFFTESEFTVVFDNWTKSNGTYTANVYDSRINANKSITVEYTGNDSIAYGATVTPTQISGGVRLTTTLEPPSNLFGKIIIRDKNTLGFPAIDIDVVYDIAQKMNVRLDERSIPYINQGYTIQYPAEYTMREVLGYIGAMYGGNWIMNDLGDLQFIPLWDLPEETNLLTDELGYRLVFAGTRILVNRR